MTLPHRDPGASQRIQIQDGIARLQLYANTHTTQAEPDRAAPPVTPRPRRRPTAAQLAVRWLLLVAVALLVLAALLIPIWWVSEAAREVMS